jgi:hypothetical protein
VTREELTSAANAAIAQTLTAGGVPPVPPVPPASPTGPAPQWPGEDPLPPLEIPADAVQIPGTGIRVARVLVTPEMARQMRAHNRHNRALRKTRVDALSRALSGGGWHLTHQGIAFFTSGLLGDGQHRLEAIIESGVAAYVLVFWNVDDGAHAAVDAGARRTVTDHLRFQGIADATNEHSAVAYALYECRSVTPNPGEVLARAKLYWPAINGVIALLADGNKRICQIGAKAALVGAWYAARSDHKVAARLIHFCDILSGTTTVGDGPAESAAYALRDRLVRQYVTTPRKIGGSDRRTTYGLTLRAFAAFAQMQPLAEDELAEPLPANPFPLPGEVGPAAAAAA